MLSLLVSYTEYILNILQILVPCLYFDLSYVALCGVVYLLSRYFNYEIVSFYYVTFFGLFPYRLFKAMLNSSVIPLWSILFLTICFFIIWKFINDVIPYVFNSFAGQLLVACSLFVADKLLFLFDILKEKPASAGFSFVSFIFALSCYWVTWGIPSFFFFDSYTVVLVVQKL
jgi:hypothetical protein